MSHHPPGKNGRTYEEDLDYVLEREVNSGGGGGGSVGGGGGGASIGGGGSGIGGGGGGGVVKGQEVRPLVHVDNYAKVYGGNNSMEKNGGSSTSGVGGGEPQPYHTRYDSKPFSYIR